jgi:hypothetical protein
VTATASSTSRLFSARVAITYRSRIRARYSRRLALHDRLLLYPDVTQVMHVESALTHFSYEIAPDLEPGTTFYNKQCGQGGFILGSVLRSNTYEHESGTQKGHYQQYRDKLAEPDVNYAKYAEPLWGRSVRHCRRLRVTFSLASIVAA